MVKVYDIDKKIQEESLGTKRPLEKKVAVIRGPNGIIVSDNEAYHFISKSDEETYRIFLCPAEEGKIVIFPTESCIVSIKELEKYPAEDMKLRDFIRTFGNRIERNYALLLDSIREIGLDPKDFSRT